MAEQHRDGEPVTQPPVVSRTGTIAVRTTERGLPTQLKIGAAEMSRAPEDLARDILALADCPQCVSRSHAGATCAPKVSPLRSFAA